jgi:hypothetical protein
VWVGNKGDGGFGRVGEVEVGDDGDDGGDDGYKVAIVREIVLFVAGGGRRIRPKPSSSTTGTAQHGTARFLNNHDDPIT